PRPRAALPTPRAGGEALVAHAIDRQFGVQPASTLRLDTPAGRLELPVAGGVVDYVSPRGSVIVARATYQRWWRDSSVNRFHVTLRPGASVDAIRHAIATEVGAEQGLKVLTQRELYAYHQDAVRRAFRLTHALEVLPLIVAALGL